VSRVELTPLEVASGLVNGDGAAVVLTRTSRTPREALEDAILPALRRGPCLVSFSGGRDSSAVLAVATALARREGMPLPIPATNRFPGDADADETQWQESVVAHLGLDEWVRIEIDDALDCVGPVAQRVLRTHGLLWPFNVHFHVPILDAAAGGSVLTGIGGDEVLAASRWDRAQHVLRRPSDARPRDVLPLALAVAPRPVRRAVAMRRAIPPFPWLRAGANAELHRALARDEVDEPFDWAGRQRWRAERRYLQVGARSLERLAAGADAAIAHPFLDVGFLSALGALSRRDRTQTRTQAMRHLFGDVLPEAVLARTAKARFDGPFWNASSRAFAAAWDGTGVDETLVDADALRREWSAEAPNPRTFTPLQSVWLAANRSAGGDRRQEPLARVGE
jgi:asparagine synthetase B (glutamine-hydrolysing)